MSAIDSKYRSKATLTIWMVGGILFTLLATGCHSLGPRSISGSHALYSQAVSLSLNEQFLQNLVRLRYRDTPYFLEVGNITASLKFESSVGLDAAVTTGSGSSLLAPDIGFSYSTTPTISYAPLQGEDFLRKLLVAVPLESLFVLMQSGWKANRVLGICVERINNLENAPTASGPTPDISPAKHEEFVQFLELLENVRNKELIRAKIDDSSAALLVQIKSGPGDEANIEQIKQILGLDQERVIYDVGSDFLQIEPHTISIRTRSIMSILFYLSQSVEVPEIHEDKGLVTVTRREDGTLFDWSETPAGQIFRVYQSSQKPDNAFLAVPYRDHWFYIKDNDLDSKASFMLMSQLFSLNAGSIKSVSPMLTIPVGR